MQFLHALHRQQFANNAAVERRGLGFAAPDYFSSDYGGGDFANPPNWFDSSWGYDPYSWSWPGGGGSEIGTYDFNSPGFNGGFEDWGAGYWYDPYSGVLFDPYGGAVDVWGTRDNYTDDLGNRWIIDERTGDYTLGDGSINDSVQITDTIDAPVVLPNIDTVDWDYVLNNVGGYIQLPGGPVYLPVNDPPPPKNASKEARAAYLKRKAEETAKKIAQASASGGAPGAGGKPQSVPPNAQGKCPQGYAPHPQTKQCVLIPKPGTDLLQLLKDNPLYLFLGAIVLILLAKK